MYISKMTLFNFKSSKENMFLSLIKELIFLLEIIIVGKQLFLKQLNLFNQEEI